LIVLDTHAWIWWVTGSAKLPRRVKRRLDRANGLGVSAISCWEVGMLVVRGRLRLDRAARDWVRQALSVPRVELVPLDAEAAVAAAELPDFGGDPADRLIVASARQVGAPLATADERIANSNLVAVVW
jgi:PIN domain nuclease of toxin-antitoxin system